MKVKSSQIFCFQIAQMIDFSKMLKKQTGDHARFLLNAKLLGSNKTSETAEPRESMGEAADLECRNQHSSSLAKVPGAEFLHKAGFLVGLFKPCFSHKPPSKARKHFSQI